MSTSPESTASKPGKDRGPGDFRSATVLGWIAFTAGLGSFFLAGSGGVISQNPPEFQSNWVVSWLCCGIALVLALAACVQRRNRAVKLLASLAIGLGLLASWFPTASYYGNYHTYPWLIVVGLSLLSVIGGWVVGLRVLPLASSAFLATWFYAAFLPPQRASGDVVVRQGDLEMTLLSRETSRGLTFKVRDFKGRDLSKLVDLEHIEFEGQVGPFIEVEAWPPMFLPFTMIDETPRGPTVTMSVTMFPPHWARSFDLKVIVPRWPDAPTAQVSIPLDKIPQLPLKASSGSYTLAVTDAHWGPSRTSQPPDRRLLLTLTYSGFSYGGSNGKEIRVVDEHGDVLPLASSSCTGASSDTTIDCEVGPMTPGAKVIRVQLIGEGQATETIFSFGRVGTE